jgi:hypothetical protein
MIEVPSWILIVLGIAMLAATPRRRHGGTAFIHDGGTAFIHDGETAFLRDAETDSR